MRTLLHRQPGVGWRDRGWLTYSVSAVLVGFTVLVAILFAVIHKQEALSIDDVLMQRDVPHAVPPLAPPLFSRDSSEGCLIDSILSQTTSFPAIGSGLCHLLRVYGLGPLHHDRFSCGQEVVSALTDVTVSQERLGRSLAFQTRHGARFRFAASLQEALEWGGENHQDLTLAALAELGLPLATPLRTETGVFELRDVLKDSLAHFTLRQGQIAWTAIAYALYLPPQKAWCNRDGERFTFDDLTAELLRPERKEPCGGTHLLYAMTLLVRVDSASPCLSAPTRQAVLGHLRQRVSAAVASQTKEGYWAFGWDGSEVAGETPAERRLITGHLIEWMQRLPKDLQPSPEVYRRAASWLCSQLAGDPLEPADFCPWTHAVCSVRNLIGEVDGPSAPVECIPTGRWSSEWPNGHLTKHF